MTFRNPTKEKDTSFKKEDLMNTGPKIQIIDYLNKEDNAGSPGQNQDSNSTSPPKPLEKLTLTKQLSSVKRTLTT